MQISIGLLSLMQKLLAVMHHQDAVCRTLWSRQSERVKATRLPDGHKGRVGRRNGDGRWPRNSTKSVL